MPIKAGVDLILVQRDAPAAEHRTALEPQAPRHGSAWPSRAHLEPRPQSMENARERRDRIVTDCSREHCTTEDRRFADLEHARRIDPHTLEKRHRERGQMSERVETVGML